MWVKIDEFLMSADHFGNFLKLIYHTISCIPCFGLADEAVLHNKNWGNIFVYSTLLLLFIYALPQGMLSQMLHLFRALCNLLIIWDMRISTWIAPFVVFTGGRMSKLLQWLCFVAVYVALWLSALTDSLPVTLSYSWKEVVFAVSTLTDTYHVIMGGKKNCKVPVYVLSPSYPFKVKRICHPTPRIITESLSKMSLLCTMCNKWFLCLFAVPNLSTHHICSKYISRWQNLLCLPTRKGAGGIMF